jgi:hypothetical protein
MSILTGKNVVGAPVSNTDAFLSRDTCVSSTQLNRPKRAYLLLEIPKLQEVFL